jgi:putative RNA 2'-phosphotransferase
MNVKTISKFLSKHLRHEPESLGLKLQEGGWVLVSDLLAACDRHRFPISMETLKEVVETNDKKRFAFSEDMTLIRANQGHSVDVDLQLEEKVPPTFLFHGTHERVADTIRKEGIKKMDRHHVHLSEDKETAIKVGSRRGRAVIFMVNCEAMVAENESKFYQSANGVWLTDFVPPEYLIRS